MIVSKRVWIANSGVTASDAIVAAISWAKAIDEGRSGAFGELRPYLLIVNNIVLTIDAESVAADVEAEFKRRADNGEGLYGR